MALLLKSGATAAASLALLSGFPAASASPPGEPDGHIRVEISGLRSDRGRVLCDLFASPRGFPGAPQLATAHSRAAISGDRASCDFDNVAPGSYAVSVGHDENANGKVDRGVMGIPTEGVGSSLNPRGRLAPPKFADAAFRLDAGRRDLKVAVQYFGLIGRSPTEVR